jgi:hypothetical protein
MTRPSIHVAAPSSYPTPARCRRPAGARRMAHALLNTGASDRRGLAARPAAARNVLVLPAPAA